MLTRRTLKLPTSFQTAIPDITTDDWKEAIKQLVAAQRAQKKEFYELFKALQAYTDGLNNKGVLQIAQATIEDSTIDNTPVGGTTPAAGAFSTVSATGQITSTLADGTAPMVVTSTTKVANLNVDKLDGKDWAAPDAIGSTTPAAADFTTLETTGYAKFGADGRQTAFSKSNASLGVGADLDCTNATDGLIAVRNNTNGGVALVTVDFTVGCAEAADVSGIVTVGGDPGAGSNQFWVTTNGADIRVRNRYVAAKDVSVWYLLFGGTPA